MRALRGSLLSSLSAPHKNRALIETTDEGALLCCLKGIRDRYFVSVILLRCSLKVLSNAVAAQCTQYNTAIPGVQSPPGPLLPRPSLQYARWLAAAHRGTQGHHRRR